MREFLFHGWPGCSNHGCIVTGPRHGMGTNSTCQCVCNASRSQLNILQQRLASLSEQRMPDPAERPTSEQLYAAFEWLRDHALEENARGEEAGPAGVMLYEVGRLAGARVQASKRERDAQRYRWLRDHGRWMLSGDELLAAVDGQLDAVIDNYLDKEALAAHNTEAEGGE